MDRQYILGKISPFRGEYSVLNNRQEVSDIIQGILRCHDKYKKEYDKICVSFGNGGVRKISQNIWDFLKENVRYKVEGEDRQYLKSPAAILHPGTTSDCKNFALFTGGVLDALKRKGKNIDWAYRFASYNILTKTPQHVFVVVNPGENEIWIDPVLSTFDNRKQYFYKIDKQPKMALISLAGTEIGKAHPKRQKFFKKLLTDMKKAGKFVLKYGLAAQRNGILLAMHGNLFSLGTNSKKALDKGDKKIFDFWENIGGKKEALEEAIIKGSKHKRIGAPIRNFSDPAGTGGKAARFYADTASAGNQPSGGYDEGAGDTIGDPVTGAAAASALPFILKIVDWFKKLGLKKEDIDQMGKSFQKAHDETAKDVEQAIKDEAEGKETKTGDNVYKQHVTGSGIPKIALIGGAALLGAYFLTKKK